MVRFQFHTRMLIVLRATLPIKKSIIGRRRLQKSMSSLSDDMVLNGATKETVETVPYYSNCAADTGLKPSETEIKNTTRS